MMAKYPGTDGNMNSMDCTGAGSSTMVYGMNAVGFYPSHGVPPGGSGELKKGGSMVTNVSDCYLLLACTVV